MMIRPDDKLRSLYLKHKNTKPAPTEHVGRVLVRELPMGAEKTRFFLFLSLIEKSIIAFRQGRFRSGEFYYEKFMDMDRDFPERISLGAMALTGGLESYRCYVLEDYETAEGIMRVAIRHSMRQSDRTLAFLGSAFEQWLNLMRLLITMEDYDRLGDELRSYFVFLKGVPQDGHFIFNGTILEKSRHLDGEKALKHHFFIIGTVYARLLARKKENCLLEAAKGVFFADNLFRSFVSVMNGTAERSDLEQTLPYYHLLPEKPKQTVDGIFAQ